jgi:glycosyltransferase involved in cell wall biosynthesis
MHILRNRDRDRFAMDFLVHTESPEPLDDEVRALGSKIIPCPLSAGLPKYAWNFSKILRQFGPYDIVHSHVQHFSGIPLFLAARAGVPGRIAHSNNDTTMRNRQAGLKRRLYLRFMKGLIHRYGTKFLACSKQAAVSLVGPEGVSDPRHQVLPYGIDLSRFVSDESSQVVRRELGIPAETLVIGHVGSFKAQKNHRFLIEIAKEIKKRHPDTYVLLVGDGKLRPAIEDQVAQSGLSGNVIFAGSRTDVPRLLLHAMDIFLFPSFFEGVPVALAEAQAAGLRCVVADNISEETEVVKPLIRRVALSENASTWADHILDWHKSPPPLSQSEALAQLKASELNISVCLKNLENIYESLGN